MCYIQVSEHLRATGSRASMPQGRISSVFQEYGKTFMFPSVKQNVDQTNDNQVGIKHSDVVYQRRDAAFGRNQH